MKVDTNCILSLPVTLNCWKHHAGFIKRRISTIRNDYVSDAELKKILLVIGKSRTDIYLGSLSPLTIRKEILFKLSPMNYNAIEEYKRWLHDEDKDYKLLRISDNSIWTLRLGEDTARFIHIHPGRHSPNTVRVRALTLKTSIAVMIKKQTNIRSELDLKAINVIRINMLDAPPLKTLSGSSGLGKFLGRLNVIRV
jgi:hypothetical protein